jgi:acetyltransferase-like isoleucine patch superfamily enzyme
VMRKEEERFYADSGRVDPIGFRLAEAWRRVTTPLALWGPTRAGPGSRRWHRAQEKLAQGTSVGVDAERRNRFLSATLPGRPRGLFVLPGVNFCYPANLNLGEDVFINRGVCIDAPAPVTIGDACLLGPYTVINSGNHAFSNPEERIRDQGHTCAPIRIGNDVWLGAHVVVLAGATIGDGAVVGAGSVVKGDVLSGAVVAGRPAVEIGRRGANVEERALSRQRRSERG